jgi:sulfite reductase alpha subunit-like flavoprotein
MGKVIDKRFEELGGKRMLELHCADEATGLEETVEAWKLLIEAKVKEVVTQHIEA